MPTNGMGSSEGGVARLLSVGLEERSDFEYVLRKMSAADWEQVQRQALTAGLLASSQSRFHRERVSIAEREICSDPYTAILRFPVLTKRVYWDHAADLRLEGYEALVAHTFHTSGTELGVPTEQPWDDWTFRRSFCESSALALTRAGAPKGTGAVIGSPSFGALAKSYIWAAERLGLRMTADGSAFNDESCFQEVLAFARRPETDTLIATLGGIVSFIDRAKKCGVAPASLGIRRVISGIGNFLTERHVQHIVGELEPDVVLEQGGKNEILHALGGVRYDRRPGGGVCWEGHLHYLPHVAYVTAVDVKKFAEGVLQPVPHGSPGVLLMTRLSSGRDGIVAFVNDAGDFGTTRGIATTPEALCPCGSALPAFRFLGRVGGTVTNRLGDTLFIEEFGQALSGACAAVGIRADLAARIRFQIVLVRQARWETHDVLYWVIGVSEADRIELDDKLGALKVRFIEQWVGYATYADGRYDRYMRFGRGAVVDVSAFPHAGRDKPQYPLSELIEAPEGTDYDTAFEHHLSGKLKARVYID